MRVAVTMLVLAGALTACQKADQWNSADPVHCMTVFSLASAGAATASDTALANDMNARMLRIVQANGGVAWLQQITPESQRIAAEIEASPNKEGLRKLLEDCSARHPPA
jgi:hypothetical protein